MKVLLTAVFVAGTAVLMAQSDQLAPPKPGDGARFDVLIRGARVMDGSGNPWLRADVGITGDRITAVGTLTAATATRVIDAGDRILAPGFIDVHSHAAEGLTRPALHQAQPLIAQGITTLVVNPDGGGPVDLAAQRAAIEQARPGPNVALLIGHGSVRRTVMKESRAEPAAAELQQMKDLVRRGMQEGAFGLSSGLFYVPGSFAKTEEVIELTKVAAEFGGLYTSHVRDEGNYDAGVRASVAEVIRIAEEARTIGVVSHMKALGKDSWGLGPALIKDMEEARARGVQVFADQYPYEASSTNLRAALAPGGVEPTEAVVTENLRRRNGPDAVLIAQFAEDRTLAGKTLTEIARLKGISPVQAAIAMIRAGGASIVSFNMSEPDIEAIMKAPFTMASSDGGLPTPGVGQPHPRDYGAFARRLAVYVRERKVVPLEFAIRSMTSLPAAVFGIPDRGAIRPGAIADVVIFDPARVRDAATYTAPQALAEGMSDVLVNGVPVLLDGRFTDASPGRVLKKGLR
ncbi:MAG TPA: D-aminoacylase [Vicinamibacterales bacterium]|nr:D-aminoacylase [Vicinamibacterales bacterium]